MLKLGDQAPAFDLESDAGKRVKLDDFKGRSLVVYFYPKDDTPGCTREAQAFNESLDKLAKAGAAVVGVAKDTVASHVKFRDKYSLAFPLLSDPDLTVHNAFGAYGEKTMYGKKVQGTIRSTFIIGPDGKVSRVFGSVKVDGHADKVLEALAGLALPAAGVKSKPKKTDEPKAKAKAGNDEEPIAKKTAAPKPLPAAKKRAAKSS